jgi:cyclopropane-fatty-acyl-phospholipid synthase
MIGNELIIVIIAIFMIICMLYFVYLLCEPTIAKITIINILNGFEKGNLIVIGEDKNKIVDKINDNSYINKVYINNEKCFFTSVYSKSDLGLGESYIRGEWTTDNLVEFLTLLGLNVGNMNTSTQHAYYNFFSYDAQLDKKHIQHHYDVGNDFYLKFLTDDLSAYSCGFWFNPKDTLNDAQHNKVNTIIQKMETKPNRKILDIGCGWGKIANYVAYQTNCHVTGITVSDKQAMYGKANYDQTKVKILNMDYRLLNEKFDYIYSIGMFEHIRYENYDTFFKTIKKCLAQKGRFVLHTIISLTESDPRYVRESFISKHIFPGGQIPTNDWITTAVIRNGLNIIHYEGYGGQHYAKTLKVWRKNMLNEKKYIIENYGEDLLKKYEFYFAICETGFRLGYMGIGHYIIVNEPVISTDNSFNWKIV